MSCVGSKYQMTDFQEHDGRIRRVPYTLAMTMQERGDGKIIGGILLMAEKEIVVKKTDGSIHQLPAPYAEKLIANKEATLVEPTTEVVADSGTAKKKKKKIKKS